MKNSTILTLGACSWTTLFKVDTWPSGSAKIMPHTALQLGDGMSASAACSIAALGGKVAWLGRCGNDANGRAAIQSLESTGVDCSGVQWVDGVAGSFCTVLIDAQGERLVVPRHDPAMPSSADWLPLADLKQYALALTEVRWHEGALAVLKAAKQAGIPGILDAEASGDRQLAQLCQEASHLLFSETGLTHWLKKPGHYFSETIATKSLHTARVSEALVLVLAGTPCDLAGVTLGDGGFYWMQRSADNMPVMQHQPAMRVTAIDTLSAGDVFHGTYAWAMTQSADPIQWARIATIAASLKCQKFGGRLGTPTWPEIEAALSRL